MLSSAVEMAMATTANIPAPRPVANDGTVGKDRYPADIASSQPFISISTSSSPLCREA